MCQQRKGATQIFHLLYDLAGRVKHLSPRTVGFALILPFNLFLWVDSGTLIDTKRSETKELSSPALLKYWNSRNSISCSQNSNRYSLKSFRFPRFCSDLFDFGAKCSVLEPIQSTIHIPMIGFRASKTLRKNFYRSKTPLLDVCNTIYNNMLDLMFQYSSKQPRESIGLSPRCRS